jgi:hypothetical protein
MPIIFLQPVLIESETGPARNERLDLQTLPKKDRFTRGERALFLPANVLVTIIDGPFKLHGQTSAYYEVSGISDDVVPQMEYFSTKIVAMHPEAATQPRKFVWPNALKPTTSTLLVRFWKEKRCKRGAPLLARR